MIVRRDQIDTLARARLEDFEDRMLEHLRAHFRQSLADRPEDELRRLIRTALERARAHGADRPAAYCQFLDLTVALGEGFDTNPDLPWAAHVLRDASLPDANARIAELALVAVEYLQARSRQQGPSPPVEPSA